MKLSLAGAAFVRHHEGFVAQWYLDPVNIPTIGTGFTWASAAFREWWGKNRPGIAFKKGATITRVEADACLQFMCAREYGAAVNTFLGKTVAQHVFDGMTSSVYNLGPGSLKWTWAAAAKSGDLKGAAARLRTTGTTARGVKLRGLVIRREQEARLLEHGDYSTGAPIAAPKEDAMADGVLVKGERGPSVSSLQAALASLGLYDGEVDGIFGFGTERAVLEYQRANGLKPDGYAGKKTLDALHGNPVEAPAPRPPMAAPRSPVAVIVGLIVAGATGLYAFAKSQGWVP